MTLDNFHPNFRSPCNNSSCENTSWSYNISNHEDDNNKILSSQETADKVYGVLCLILIPFVCSGNILVLVALFKFRKLRTTTNILIGNLSVADFFMGAVILPTYAGFYFNRITLEKDKWLCLFKFSVVTCSSSASLLSLVAIAVDRYIAIIYPLSYQRIVTSRRVKILICCMWLYEIIKGSLPFVWNYYDSIHECNYFRAIPKVYTITFSFVSIAVVLVVSLFMYVRIFIVASRHRKRLAQETHASTASARRRFEREARSAKTMAFVMILFYLFWIPFLFIGPLKYLGLSPQLIEILKNGAILFAMSNSMVNPFVYCWMRSEFNRAIHKMCLAQCGGQQLDGTEFNSYNRISISHSDDIGLNNLHKTTK